MVTPSFVATCEVCGGGQELTYAQEHALVGDDGSFVCDKCARRSKWRPWRSRKAYPRDMGCIVTAEYADGSLHVFHEWGYALEALRVICDRLPAGASVRAISTHRSIARDLKGEPRRYTGDRSAVDPYAVERHLLGKIGRLDLLPANAERLHNVSPSQRRGYEP